MEKNGLIPRGTRVDATWHARPHGSATQTHAAPMRRIMYIYLYSLSYI